jgi:Tryptophan-associated transmembrane protein (Trp_oprn_chp)
VRDTRSLRTTSFALTVGGALFAAGLTTVTWTSSGLRRDLRGLLDLEFRGLDLPEGIVALVVSGLALALVFDVRRRRGNAGIRAIVILLTGLALVALPAWVAFGAEDRAVDEVADVVARSAGITTEEARERVRSDPDLAVRTDSRGVWPSIAAGVLVTLGGVTLLWIGRRPPDLEAEAPST